MPFGQSSVNAPPTADAVAAARWAGREGVSTSQLRNACPASDAQTALDQLEKAHPDCQRAVVVVTPERTKSKLGTSIAGRTIRLVRRQKDNQAPLYAVAPTKEAWPELWRKDAAEAARRASRNAITVARDATDSGPVVRTTVALAGLVAVLAATTQLDGWIAEHALGVMSAVFAVGYAGIVLEDLVEIDKAAVSLMMAVALWTVLSTAQIPSSAGTLAELSGHLAETADICFFLISAQAVVGLVDAHDGFRVLTETLGKLGDVRNASSPPRTRMFRSPSRGPA